MKNINKNEKYAKNKRNIITTKAKVKAKTKVKNKKQKIIE